MPTAPSPQRPPRPVLDENDVVTGHQFATQRVPIGGRAENHSGRDPNPASQHGMGATLAGRCRVRRDTAPVKTVPT